MKRKLLALVVLEDVYNAIFKDSKWRHGRDRMVVEITMCAYLSSNPTHGEVYSIQHYMMNLSVACDRSVIFSGYS